MKIRPPHRRRSQTGRPNSALPNSGVIIACTAPRAIHPNHTPAKALPWLAMACCAEPPEMAADAPEVRRERKGYWLTGFATGPDTTMGVLWGAALLLVAAKDGTCHQFNGRSSGADGASCVPTADWNNSFFRDVGGLACLSTNVLGDPVYNHDASVPACAAAFSACACAAAAATHLRHGPLRRCSLHSAGRVYALADRATPAYTGDVAFTCNCSGPATDHTFLGEGGLRPSQVRVGAWIHCTRAVTPYPLSAHHLGCPLRRRRSTSASSLPSSSWR